VAGEYLKFEISTIMDFALKKITLILAVVFASFPLAFDAMGVIQYTDFGGSPVTMNTAVPIANITVPGSPSLGTIRFQWGQAGNTRFGEVRFVGAGNQASLLTTGSDISMISTNDTLSSSSSIWNGYTTWQRLFEYDMEDQVFASPYLSNSQTGTIGARFNVGGSTYYAWINISNIANDGSSFTVQALALNDTPDAPIMGGQTADPPPPPPPPAAIPEPASVGLILLGAAGLTMLRRRDD
jgi:hypothetical protein